MEINPLEFVDRCEFGTKGYKVNENNGNKVKTFVPKFSRWFGWRNQTFNQQFQLSGVTKTDTKQIAVRHDDSINSDLLVRINGRVYRCLVFSPDQRSMRETFDLLTLTEVTKP